MKKFFYMNFITFFLLGCSSLEQSALVYTSTISVGAGFEVDAQGTGFEATLGYKQNDLAYVPVAVSEKAESTDNLNIQKDHTSWEIISGYSDGPTSDVDKSTTTSQSSSQNNLNDNDKIISDEQKITDQKKELQSRVDELTVQIKSENSSGNNQDKIRALEQELDTTQKELIDLTESQINNKETRSGDVLKDAFSVYGTFNSSASGSASGAGIDLGRVFSTGVAAQKLARAVQVSAEMAYSNAVIACITQLERIVTKGKSTSEIKEIPSNIYQICSKPRENTQQ